MRLGIKKLALTCAMIALMGATSAEAMTVQPVILDLKTSGSQMSQTLAVQNTSETPLPVEIRVESLEPDADGLKGTGKDPGDLLVFPPQAIIQPGQTQTFRVQWVGNPAIAKSQHYYVTVAQLPVSLPEGKSAIQILYNFQVLVSVAQPDGVPNIKVSGAKIIKTKDGAVEPEITFTNDSPTYGYLSHGKLDIKERDAGGHIVFEKVIPGPELQQTIGFGLVAAGQTRHISLPIKLPNGGGSVEASFAGE